MAKQREPKVDVKDPVGLGFQTLDLGALQPWHRIARGYLGIKEVPGPMRNNATILAMHQETSLGADSDEVAWCSSAMNYWLGLAGYPTTRSAAAKSWLDWGAALDVPRVGCLVILKRTGGHHVGLYEGEHNGRIMLLGGNQSDAATIAGYKREDVLGYRWPTSQLNLKPST